MMKACHILSIFLAVLSPGSIDAFLSVKPTTTLQQKSSSTTPSSLNVFDPSSLDASEALSSAANNMWLATIDADIDAIPDNEFGLVFAGGIVVMLGGILSALIVGFILDKGDLYANVAAESYLQSADDEEFWKGLSDEEKKKTQEMLKKIKESKEGGNPTSTVVESSSEPVTTPDTPKAPEKSSSDATTKGTDMFSDYGD